MNSYPADAFFREEFRADLSYADYIENAFQKDKTKKRKLLSALVDYNLGYLSECVKKLTALLKQSETIEERRVAKYFIALCYKRCGKSDAAAELYHQILDESPAYSPALSNLSAFYFEKQNYRKAIEFAEKAINCNSGNPFAYNNLAGAYLELYDFEKAKKYALRALDLKKDLYQAQTTLSIAFAVEGDALAAKKYAELAVSLGEDANALAAATQNYKKDYARHQVIQARLADWKQKTGIPAIHFTLDGQFEKSIIGGRINEPAPISASGKSMRLLAAIFCSELPENNIFPQHGVLRFYISPDAYYGASLEHYEEMNIQKEFRFFLMRMSLLSLLLRIMVPKMNFFRFLAATIRGLLWNRKECLYLTFAMKTQKNVFLKTVMTRRLPPQIIRRRTSRKGSIQMGIN